MKLDIRLPDGTTKQVKAHRILKNTYPSLELYAHYSDASNDDSKFYNISVISGYALADRAYVNLRLQTDYVKKIIDTHGEAEVLKRAKQKTPN